MLDNSPHERTISGTILLMAAGILRQTLGQGTARRPQNPPGHKFCVEVIPVRIYTRTGDKGETSLRWGERIGKDTARVEAYGEVDEANSFIGLGLSLLPSGGGETLEMVRLSLTRAQREMFDVGADLATPPNRDKGERPKVQAEYVTKLEQDIDWLDARLAPLKSFILPSGAPAAAALHVARTVTRRAERRVVALSRADDIDPMLLQYLNRLSDALFVFARAVNQALGVEESKVIWEKNPH